MKERIVKIKEFFIKTQSICVITLILLSTLVPFIYLGNNLNYLSKVMNNDFVDNLIDSETDLVSDKISQIDNRIHFSYIPIDDINGSGDSFTVNDNLQVYHPFSLELDSDNGRSDSYTISTITDYSVESLEYDMEITSKTDFFIQQTAHNKDEILGSNTIRVAQGFNVPWTYGVFTGARIYLIIDTAIGADEIEMFVVSENVTDGTPDLSNILSIEIDGPYNSTNPITESTPSNTVFYNFTDTILSSGDYYVVINITNYDASNNDGFNWRGQQGSIYADSYVHDGSSWSLENKDFILAPELMPSYSDGSPLIFADPTDISLEDNGTPITSLTQTISSTGSHTITADTSVQISLNNSYSFSRQFSSLSNYQISNSSFGDYSVNWFVDWFIPQVSIVPYENPIRFQNFYTPNDWNDTSFEFMINDSIPLSGMKISTGYVCYLENILSSNLYSSGDITLQTSTPNYLFGYSISDELTETDTFNLGYWTTDGNNATGYEGSVIDAQVLIKDTSYSDITTGELNFTIFNTSGEIIPLKAGLPSNLSYVDNHSYSILSSSQISSGVYQLNTSFDPSVYGTDIAGSWTVMLHWVNGTEVGFVSKQIHVKIATTANFEWEISPGSDMWTSDNLTQVSRINGESLRVRAGYFTTSEPYFSGIGVPITDANVSYYASWLSSGTLDYETQYYEASIIIDVIGGEYSIDLVASRILYSTYTIDFPILVLHQFSISAILSEYHINFLDNIDIRFSLVDISNMSTPILPDSITLLLNGTAISSSDYSYGLENNFLEVSLDIQNLNLEISYYELNISASKNYFIESYSKEETSTIVYLHTEQIPTTIQLVSSPSAIYQNNQTTISFRYIDNNHSTPIRDAIFSVESDITEMEIVTQYEEEGLYTVVIRIFEPTETSMNIFLSISKDGYEAKANIHLTTLSIDEIETPIITDPNGLGTLTLILIIVSVTLAVLLLGASYFYVRFRRKKMILLNKQETEKARNIFQSVMMIKKILIVHQETSLPVFDLNVYEDVDFDPSMVSGVLQAISSIGTEMIKAPTGVKKIEYYGFVVTSGYSGVYTVYIFSETELCIEMVEGISNIAQWFDIIFGYDGTKWDGSMELYHDYENQIREKVAEELFLWLLYPLELVSGVSEKLESMKEIDKVLIKFLKNKGASSVIQITDQVQEYEDEEIIRSIIRMKDEQKLIVQIE